MDPLKSVQDLVRCTPCQASVASMFCEACHIHLCKDCVEKHLSDSSIVHTVVSLKQYADSLNYPKCRKHSTKQCELHCKQCDSPICVLCISSGEHIRHQQIDISKTFETKKKYLQRELEEIEEYIYPKYKDVASNISMQKADLNKNSQQLSTAINKQGKVWHIEIDNIIKNLKSDVEEIESKYLIVLNKHEGRITRTISEIKQTIADIKKLLNSNDVCLVFEYKSKNAEFRRLPQTLKVPLPIANFRPQEINSDQLTELFGSLSALSFTKEKQDYSMSTQGAEYIHQDRPLRDKPRVTTAINTGCRPLYDVTCLNDTEIWMCGNDMLKLYNLWGNQVKSIRTKSGSTPQGISVTKSGDLVYPDENDRTVNIVNTCNTQIQTLIRLRGWIWRWIPVNVCSTTSGDLLVVMNSHGFDKQTKVVRYSGLTEKQSIQVNDKGQPLFSPGGIFRTKYISENRNLDICVSDRGACAVVVVNQAGKLRFIYTGQCSTTKKVLYPSGITTDSLSRILIADDNNHCIHIVDQDGQFLRYIDNCGLERPFGLCMDTKDNLYVAEFKTGKVKKIQYYI